MGDVSANAVRGVPYGRWIRLPRRWPGSVAYAASLAPAFVLLASAGPLRRTGHVKVMKVTPEGRTGKLWSGAFRLEAPFREGSLQAGAAGRFLAAAGSDPRISRQAAVRDMTASAEDLLRPAPRGKDACHAKN